MANWWKKLERGSLKKELKILSIKHWIDFSSVFPSVYFWCTKSFFILCFVSDKALFIDNRTFLIFFPSHKTQAQKKTFFIYSSIARLSVYFYIFMCLLFYLLKNINKHKFNCSLYLFINVFVQTTVHTSILWPSFIHLDI